MCSLKPTSRIVFCLSVLASCVFADDRTHYTYNYRISSLAAYEFGVIAFSLDSKQLAVSGANRLDLIDLSNGEERTFPNDALDAMGYSRDGQQLVLIRSRRTELLDLRSLSRRHVPKLIDPGYLGFALEKRNGKLLISKIHDGGAVDKDGNIRVGDELLAFAGRRNWLLESAEGMRVEKVYGLLKGPAGTHAHLKVTPKGKYGQTPVYTIRRQSRSKQIRAIDTNPQLVWTQRRGEIYLQSAETGKAVAHIEPVDITMRTFGFGAVSPDQSTFAFVSRLKKNDRESAVELFDVKSQERLTSVTIPSARIFDVGFLPDGQRMFVATRDTIEIVDLRDPKLDSTFELDTETSSPKVASRPSNIRDESSAGFTNARRQFPSGRVAKMAVSKHNVLATADRKGDVRLYDVDSAKRLLEIPLGVETENEPEEVEFSPDGNWLAYHVDGILHLVDVSDVRP